MPLFEVAIIKKKTDTSPDILMDMGIVPLIADNKEQARDKVLLDPEVRCITSENIGDYEVLVRPFV